MGDKRERESSDYEESSPPVIDEKLADILEGATEFKNFVTKRVEVDLKNWPKYVLKLVLKNDVSKLRSFQYLQISSFLTVNNISLDDTSQVLIGFRDLYERIVTESSEKQKLIDEALLRFEKAFDRIRKHKQRLSEYPKEKKLCSYSLLLEVIVDLRGVPVDYGNNEETAKNYLTAEGLAQYRIMLQDNLSDQSKDSSTFIETEALPSDFEFQEVDNSE